MHSCARASFPVLSTSDTTERLQDSLIDSTKTALKAQDIRNKRPDKSGDFCLEGRKASEQRQSLQTQRKRDFSIASKVIHKSVKDARDMDIISLIHSLQACAKKKDLQEGSKLHTDIVRKGSLENNVFVATTLIHMYTKCGALVKAQEAFDKLTAPNVASWNALIAGYAQNGHGKQALKYFEQMLYEGYSPDAVTLSCALKACGSIGALDKGRDIHLLVMQEHVLEEHIVVTSALIDMYAKCGEIKKAQQIFDNTPIRSEVMWNALITGYSQLGLGAEALDCYKQMQWKGFSPDAITYASILKACGRIGALDEGRAIHAQVMRDCFLEDDLVLGNALVDMYAKCGALLKAKEVFFELPVRDDISWTALITGYGVHGHGEGALKLFRLMQKEGFSPNTFTFACILKACGNTGALGTGQEIHAQIVKERVLEKHIEVGTALLDMYVNCGMLQEAQEVFDKLSVRDVVSWSALMVGYSQNGEVETVLHLFDKMLAEGVEPNLATFTILLNTCNHRGLLEKAQMYFHLMSNGYGMTPTLHHLTCMVDLLGRAGHLDKAVELIRKMSQIPDFQMWLTLLHACRKWKNVEFGRWAFDHAVQLDATDSAAYACMNNIYADAGRHEDAHLIQAMRVQTNT